MHFKKLFGVILAGTMVASSVTGLAKSSADINDAVFELSSLGVFTGDEKGELHLDENMTRAEFAKVATVLTGSGKLASTTTPKMSFTDVPEDHWAKGYIGYCTNAGIMQGDGNGIFRPDDTIKLEECVKTVVSLMGYEVVAKEEGGYPMGYNAVAGRKHLLTGVTGAFDKPAYRRDIMMLIYNALDTPNLVPDYSENKSYYEDKDTTIRDTITKVNDINYVTGIVTANSDVWLVEENSELRPDQIEIDGFVYDVTEKMAGKASTYIGQKVTAYYNEEKGMKYPLIYNIQPTVENTIVEIDYADISDFNSNSITYWENNKEETIRFNNETQFIYNNRLETSFKDELTKIDNGFVKVIVNDEGRTGNIVMIENCESYVVDSASKNGNVKVKYMGLEAGKTKVLYKNIILDLERDNAFSISDKEGNYLTYDAIKPGTVISVYENNIDDFIKVVVNADEPIKGIVSGKDSDKSIFIEDADYDVVDEVLFNEIDISGNYIIYVDVNGNVVYAEDNKDDATTTDWKYGYILRMKEKKMGNTSVLMLSAGKVENREEANLEDRTDTKAVPVTVCKNESAETIVVSNKVKVNNSVIDGENIDAAIGKPLKYKLDSKGELKAIEYLELAGGSEETKYNATEKIFGTVNVFGTPFLINEDTKVICVPENDTTNTENLMVSLTLDNKDKLIQYNAFGYELNEETQAVNVLVLKDEMLSDDVSAVTPSKSKIGVVVKATKILDKDEECMSIEMMIGTETKKFKTASAKSNSAIDNLKSGDVIFFTEDTEGNIENARVVNNMYDVKEGNLSAINKYKDQVVGYATDVRLNRIDNINRIRVNQVDVMTADGVEFVNVPISNYPDMFIYDTKNDKVESGTIDDILCYTEYMENKENIVVVSSGTAIRAIVIVK